MDDPGLARPSSSRRPAFYAASGRWGDWWTLLHPPYTAWHLSYVVIGASLAPVVNVTRLVITVVAFFCAVGLAAHALDELHGHPLGTHIPNPALVAVGILGLAAAIVLGIVGIAQIGWPLVPFVVIGPILAVAYNFELFGGAIHNDVGFGLSWGSFPLLTAYVAQTGRLALGPVLAAIAALGMSVAQRTLSTPARMLRRRSTAVEGSITLVDGTSAPVSRDILLTPIEGTLRVLSWSVVVFATALAVTRLT